ncbi:MAG: type II toxin-antitoxin system RelE/ParE family toxin [Clostridia bacterium]|nr:type II toxin-antitoxin system RelE/ParE family toxin [Clostridia bacterium]
MRLIYSKQAVKAISGMDKPTKQRIKKAVEALPDGDIKPLQGSHGSFRLRVGGWRILFSHPDSETILIEKIAPRGEVYKGG